MDIEDRGDGVRFRVRAQPRASRTAVAGERDGALKICLAAPPVDGEANHELVRFLAKRLGIAPSRVTVRSGAASRTKLVEIQGVDAARVKLALGSDRP